MTVHLRPFGDGDAAAVLRWLPVVTAEAGVSLPADAVLSALRERALVRLVEVDSDPAGVAAWTLAGGRGRFELLALEPAARRRGCGLEAALLVEERMRAEGAGEALAPAPAAHGIAVYFWLRLGYCLLARHRWPACESSSEAVGWMGRSLNGTAARGV